MLKQKIIHGISWEEIQNKSKSERAEKTLNTDSGYMNFLPVNQKPIKTRALLFTGPSFFGLQTP